MTRRIRYALNGIDTHLTCFCAAGPTSDRPTNAIKRDANARAWASISSCGNPRAVTYLSRVRNDLAHPWTRFTALICLTYAISTLFPRVMRSEFRLTCDRTQCIFYRAIRFRRACTVAPGRAVPILSWVSRPGFSQSGYVIYSVCKPGVAWRSDAISYDRLYYLSRNFLAATNADCSISRPAARRKLSRGPAFNVAPLSSLYVLPFPCHSFGTGNSFS